MSARLHELDRISRERPLMKVESLELEREICRADGRPLPHQLSKELARHGVKRRGARIPHLYPPSPSPVDLQP